MLTLSLALPTIHSSLGNTHTALLAIVNSNQYLQVLLYLPVFTGNMWKQIALCFMFHGDFKSAKLTTNVLPKKTQREATFFLLLCLLKAKPN